MTALFALASMARRCCRQCAATEDKLLGHLLGLALSTLLLAVSPAWAQGESIPGASPATASAAIALSDILLRGDDDLGLEAGANRGAGRGAPAAALGALLD